MNVVPLSTPNLQVTLETVQKLKEDLESGRVVAFVCAAVTSDDSVLAYASSVRPVSRLRLQGAVGKLHFAIQSGEL